MGDLKKIAIVGAHMSIGSPMGIGAQSTINTAIELAKNQDRGITIITHDDDSDIRKALKDVNDDIIMVPNNEYPGLHDLMNKFEDPIPFKIFDHGRLDFEYNKDPYIGKIGERKAPNTKELKKKKRKRKQIKNSKRKNR